MYFWRPLLVVQQWLTTTPNLSTFFSVTRALLKLARRHQGVSCWCLNLLFYTNVVSFQSGSRPVFWNVLKWTQELKTVNTAFQESVKAEDGESGAAGDHSAVEIKDVTKEQLLKKVLRCEQEHQTRSHGVAFGDSALPKFLCSPGFCCTRKNLF